MKPVVRIGGDTGIAAGCGSGFELRSGSFHRRNALMGVPGAVVEGKRHEETIAMSAEEVSGAAPAHVIDIGVVQLESFVLER